MICTKCPGDKPQSEFNRSGRHASGFNHICRDCKNKQKRFSVKKVKAEREEQESIISLEKERCRRYYRKNTAKVLAKQNEYRLDNREELQINAREYYRRKTA